MDVFGIEVGDGPTAFSAQEHADRDRALMFLRPKPCPVPLLRFGGDGDGAYLIPDDLEDVSACFSPGVFNNKAFEDDLLESRGLTSYLVDYSSSPERLLTPLTPGKQFFLKKWLDVDDAATSISLEEWVKEMDPDGSDLLLQMDIEGAEYRNIIHTPVETLRRFRIIAMELHWLRKFNDARVFRSVLKPFFERLDDEFVCVHAHPNNAGPLVEIEGTGFRVPQLLEITLLRRDRIEAASHDALITPELPHPLDIDRNVRDKPPMVLDENWLESPRDGAVLARIRRDERAFLDDFSEVIERWEMRFQNRVGAQLEWIARTLENGLEASMAAEGVVGAVDVMEIAAGKPFRLSAGWEGMPTEGQVSERAPFFFHTAVDIGQSISVDLEGQFALSEIVIANRTNAFPARARLMFVIAHDEEDQRSGAGFFVPVSDAFLRGQELETRLRLRGIKARYVSIVSPFHTALHFSDLRIYGRLIEESAADGPK